jgi:hypothetical protein
MEPSARVGDSSHDELVKSIKRVGKRSILFAQAIGMRVFGHPALRLPTFVSRGGLSADGFGGASALGPLSTEVSADCGGSVL